MGDAAAKWQYMLDEYDAGRPDVLLLFSGSWRLMAS